MILATDRAANGLERPHLRAIEVERVTYQGNQYFLLHDNMGIAQQQLLAPLHFGGVLALSDGTRALPEIVDDARMLYGSPVDASEAKELFSALESTGMLEGDRFERLRQEAVADWRAQTHRPLALAGRGYPVEGELLGSQFEELLDACNAQEIPEDALHWEKGVALLSPHIDYPRGGATYAGVWKTLGAAVRSADVAVILATDHKGDAPFTFTKLDYATAYGVLPTDTVLRDALVKIVGEAAAYTGELRHRSEHSIELVVNWLHHMRRQPPIPIVPVLVGSMHRYFGNSSVDNATASPCEDDVLTSIVERLREEMQTRRVLIVASGDLAHVGPVFGGAPLDLAAITRLQTEDAHLLATMQHGSADDFFAEIRRTRDKNNVCGVTPIYLAKRVVGDLPGRCTGYAVTPADEFDTSVVTIAGMAFT